jgi:hypothetical protein
MAERFLLAYYYVTPEDFKRLEDFRLLAGDSEKYLVTQYVRGWIGKNRNYYLELAKQDAEARNISFQDWGKIVIAKGMEALPNYQKELKSIPPSPLRGVVLPPNIIRRPINYITLGKQNTALLRVGIYYDRDNTIGFVSRIVKEHLDRNWESLYLSQIEAEDFKNWK